MIRDTLRAMLRAPLRLVFPEGLILAPLLALPLLPGLFRHVAPLSTLLLVAVAATAYGLGARFGRGRPVHGITVLLAAMAIPFLGDGTPAATLAAILIPLNLALIALLPDRGVWTRGGLVRSGALLVQAAAVVAMLRLSDGAGAGALGAAWSNGAAPGAAPNPLAAFEVATLAMTVDTVLVAYIAALLTLGLLAMLTDSIPARGLFWATVSAFAVELGLPGGPGYLVATGGLMLVVATLENAHALAYRDALTGLPSRRALDELLERTARGFAVAMVDVDHFKKFNDTHGHDVGDQVLRMVATYLRDTGGGARAFRYGGEEFTLVFRGNTIQEARPHLDAVREAIETAEFGVRSPDRPRKKPKRVVPKKNGKKLSVTVSIGVAERTDGSRPAAEVLEAADAALYRAKKAGRNRVAATSA